MKRIRSYEIFAVLGLLFLGPTVVAAEESDRLSRAVGKALGGDQIDLAAVLAVASSPTNDRVVCAGKSGRIVNLGAAHATVSGLQLPTTADLTAIAVVPGGPEVVAGDKKGTVWVVNLNTNEIRGQIAAHRAAIFDVAATEQGALIVSCNPNDATASVVCTDKDLRTRKVVQLADRSSGTCCCASNQGSDIWIGNSVGRVERFGTQPLVLQAALITKPFQPEEKRGYERPGIDFGSSGERFYVRSIALAHDDSLLAAGYSDGTVRLWNPDRAEEELCLTVGKSEVFRVAFGDSSSKIAACTIGGDLAIYSIPGGARIAAFNLASGVVSSAFMDRDGRAIVVACLAREGLWQFPLPARAMISTFK